jgi:hypothetical protein
MLKLNDPFVGKKPDIENLPENKNYGDFVVNEFRRRNIEANRFRAIKGKLRSQKNSNNITFSTNYEYRVDLVSHNYYGSYKYAPLLLYVNGVSSMLDFNRGVIGETLVIPEKNVVDEYIKKWF